MACDMRAWRARILATVAAATAAACATETAAPIVQTEETPEALQAAVERVERIGALLYEKDRAAWVATDAMVASIDALRIGVRGWVTEPTSQGWRVTFVSAVGEEHFAAFQADVVDGEVVSHQLLADGRSQALSGNQREMFAVRQSVLAMPLMYCTSNVNTVLLPAHEEAGERAYDVYVFSATTDRNMIPIGGHHRVRVAAGSGEVLEQQRFSNGCLNMERDGEDAVGVGVTHVLAPHPEETHAFLSRSMDMPFYVITRGGHSWRVAGGEIVRLSEQDEAAN